MQALLDSLAYPPTHNYRLEGLCAAGPLAERAAILDRMAPDFWMGGTRFLDVGANKGYYSMRALRAGMVVTAAEPDAQFHELLEGILPAGTLRRQGFRDLSTPDTFDRIFVGNVHHHIHREVGGWEWVDKLAVLCEADGLLVIEGPTGNQCADVADRMPAELLAGFTARAFLDALGEWFELRATVGTTAYTPDRVIYVFRRRQDQLNRRVLRDTIGMRRPIQGASIDDNGTCKARVFEDVDGLIVKDFAYQARGFRNNFTIASLAPLTTPIKHLVEDGRGVVTGWGETPVTAVECAPLGNADVLVAFARNAAYLARLGYMDTDPGTSNFALSSSGIVSFDKSAIRPIADLSEAHIGRFFLNGARSYKSIGRPVWDRLADVLRTRDSHAIERAYRTIAEKVRA